MSVQNINGINYTNFKPANIQPNKTTPVNTTPAKTPEKTKDNKKKLALVLTGLAAVGIAALIIAKGKKPANVNNGKTQNSLDEVVNTGKEKIKDLIKKENLPFDPKDKTILDKDGEIFAVKDTYAKYNAQYNGKDVIVENKFISARNIHQHRNGTYGYAFIKDPETGKIIDTKRLTMGGKEIAPGVKKSTEWNVVRTAEKITDENGNKIIKTYKNGKLHSTQTTIINPDNSRQIIIKYADKGSANYKKIIDIAADGKKSVTETGSRMFSL